MRYPVQVLPSWLPRERLADGLMPPLLTWMEPVPRQEWNEMDDDNTYIINKAPLSKVLTVLDLQIKITAIDGVESAKKKKFLNYFEI